MLLVLIAAMAFSPQFASGSDDWPSYRNGRERLGSTSAQLSLPLAPHWQYQAPAPPRMAWSSAEGRVMESKLIQHRVKFDDALHPVVVGDRVFFGSSVDHHLHCRDLHTGRELWSFAVEGPIRLAPMVDGDRIYFGADDGYAYCLSADEGELIWKFDAAPADQWLLARGDMVSRWPVRTSVLVDDGVAYFGSGVFPYDGVFIYAVNADDGSLIWRQDYLSEQNAGRDDLSPQGYLLATDDLLFIPSGRSLPAALDRKTGKLVHKRSFPWRTTAGGVVGGTSALLSDGQLYASGAHHWLALDQKSGNVGYGWFAGRQVIVQGDTAFTATADYVARLDREEYAVNSRRRQELEMIVYSNSRKLSGAGDQADELRKQIQEAKDELEKIADIGIAWQQPTDDHAALLATADLLFVGGEDRVTAYDMKTGHQVWSADIPGEARGLAAAGGRLLVSTNQGHIISFGPADNAPQKLEATEDLVQNPFPQDEWTPVYEKAASEILDKLDDTRGYCLVVGNEQGRLAYELAKRSDLQIYCIEPSAEKVQAARQALTHAGLYGTRIVIHQRDFDEVPYSNYFANLIVSDSHLIGGELPGNADKLARHLKPMGGLFVLGRVADSGDAADVKSAAAWLEQSGLKDQSLLSTLNSWAVLRRGALPGAGSWSHQYGNPTNTAVGDETRISGGLGVLWYGDPGPGEVVNRHDGAAAPLALNGKMFVQGEDAIMAYDAYNGTFLWKHDNPLAIRTGVFQNHTPANLAASDDRVFYFVKDQCVELDADTGEVVRTLRLPSHKDDGRNEWGYLATQEGILVGAASVREELSARERRRGKVTSDTTDALFAIDLSTGEHLWTYSGQNIAHQTVALGPDRVYFIDSSISSDQRAELLHQDKSELAKLKGKAKQLAEQRLRDADVRRAVAIDLRTGEEKWSTAVDVTDCSEIGTGGGKLSLMYRDGVLVLGGANANGHYWAQFIEGEFKRRRLVALSAEDGSKLWARDANYKGRPIVVAGQVFAEPWSFDLLTGEQKMRIHPLTQEEVPWSLMRTGHHCGIITGCDSGMLMFRSGETAFYDLENDTGALHFGGHRLGCWVNAIPANGLVMIPEASAGCVCLVSIASTVVMEPRELRRPWAIHSAVGAKTPVRSLALNLGAPGDRKDSAGNLWFSFPRHKPYKKTSLDLDLKIETDFTADGSYRGVNEDTVEIQETYDPWLYTSWADGLQRLSVPLLGKKDEPATYQVRLHFSPVDLADAKPVVFDVQVQGMPRLHDVTLEPGAQQPLVHTVDGVQVTDQLILEFEPKQGVPRLSALEVTRSD